MRNLWVGMAIGAATGAAIGAVVDGGRKARQLAVDSGHAVSDAAKARVPEVRERIEAVTHAAGSGLAQLSGERSSADPDRQ